MKDMRSGAGFFNLVPKYNLGTREILLITLILSKTQPLMSFMFLLSIFKRKDR
jgi:hypothetical protein